MQRLGYTKYVAQGGDWGNAVSEVMALQQPPGLLGIHTNMASTVPPDVSKALSAGGPPPAGLSPEEKYAWDRLDDFYKNGLGYANEMALVRRRCTESSIRRLVLRAGYSITTFAATR